MAFTFTPMNSDPFDIRGEEMRTEAQADKAKHEAQVEIDDLKWVLHTKRGRRFVFRLLNRAGVYRSSFNTNALTMAFAEGARNEGLRLLASITEHCPDRYSELLQESKDD